MRAFRIPGVLAGLLALSCPAAAAPAAPAPTPTAAAVTQTPVPGGIVPEQVLLCRDLATRQPTLTFGLADRIYLVMTWNGLLEGPHSLRVSWINPKGRVAEETLYSFVVLRRTVRYDTWVWMQVKAPDPGVVYDYAEVLGDWTVKGYLDGVPVIDSGFRLDRNAPREEPPPQP